MRGYSLLLILVGLSFSATLPFNHEFNNWNSFQFISSQTSQSKPATPPPVPESVPAASPKPNTGTQGERAVPFIEYNVITRPTNPIQIDLVHLTSGTNNIKNFNQIRYFNYSSMVKATWNGKVIAESQDTQIVEGNHYFPASSLVQEHFEKSDKTSNCPWKGEASYYSIKVDGKVNSDAAWYYATPKDKASHIKDHVAFWKGVILE